MLTHQRFPVSLSLISLDLPVRSAVDTSATLYQKELSRFHLLLNFPTVPASTPAKGQPAVALGVSPERCSHKRGNSEDTSQMLWLDISPYRVIMTVQGNSNFSYRHLWQNRMYGRSRYWLQSDALNGIGQITLRNFTRSLTLTGKSIPEHLRLEYELWSDKLQLGRYVLDLEIHH